MSTPPKNSRRKAQAAPRPTRTATKTAPVTPPRVDAAGKLPGDKEPDFYWEDRVAAWLGLGRVRISKLRRRSLREGTDWIVHEQEVVYTVQGIQKLRDHLRSLGVTTAADKPAKVEEPAAEEPPAPVGPPTKAKARVVKTYPNKRLLLVQLEAAEGDEEKKPEQVVARVRDNSNFMPGMVLDVVRDPRALMWQHVGRLPRRRGKW